MQANDVRVKAATEDVEARAVLLAETRAARLCSWILLAAALLVTA